jgi:hypothetical protein
MAIVRIYAVHLAGASRQQVLEGPETMLNPMATPPRLDEPWPTDGHVETHHVELFILIRTGRLEGRANLVAWLSEVCRLAGRGEEAWQHARQTLDLARQHKERGNEALALYQLGVVHAHAAPPNATQAEAHYQQALALAEELGMRPLVAHV